MLEESPLLVATALAAEQNTNLKHN